MTHKFNPTILREYDIRGIVGGTLTEDDAYALGRTYGSLARDEGARRIAVGRDGRLHSGMLEAALVRGLNDSGIDVVLIGQGPSPMLYFATYYLDVDGGIQVTGSHNPAEYNGFKLLLKGRSVFGQEIQGIGERAASGHWFDGSGTIEEVDIRAAYADRLVEGFSGKAFRVGWDAGNGAAGPILDMAACSKLGDDPLRLAQRVGADQYAAARVGMQPVQQPVDLATGIGMAEHRQAEGRLGDEDVARHGHELGAWSS